MELSLQADVFGSSTFWTRHHEKCFLLDCLSQIVFYFSSLILLYSKGSRSECKQRSNKGSTILHYLNSGHKSPANPRCPPTLPSKISWCMLVKPRVRYLFSYLDLLPYSSTSWVTTRPTVHSFTQSSFGCILDQMSAWLINFAVFGNCLRRVWMVSSLFGPQRRTAWPSVSTHR